MLFKKNDTRGYRVFTVFNIIFLGLLGLVCFLPFWHIFCKSLSSGAAVSANLVGLWPSGFTLQSYREALTDTRILRALWVSVERVCFGTLFTMATTILAAYPLSFDARAFPSRRVYSCVFIFTMLFGGGTIPTYILINNILRMTDTIWAITVPGAVVVANTIMLMNFFRNLPKEIREAALVDGAGQIATLVKIYLPLSAPCLATLASFCVIGHWNAWFDALLFMRDPANYPLSTYLQVVGSKLTAIKSLHDAERMMEMSQRSITSAYTIICTVPILCAFPLLQKYIRSGLVVGAVKG